MGITLQGGVTLYAGQRYRPDSTFLALYHRLKPERIKYIDLRYDTGLAVGVDKKRHIMTKSIERNLMVGLILGRQKYVLVGDTR